MCRPKRALENAFGRMKAGFCIVHEGLECDVENVNTVIRASSVLDNICEQLSDRCDAGWLDMVRVEDQRRFQPLCTSSPFVSSGVAVWIALLRNAYKKTVLHATESMVVLFFWNVLHELISDTPITFMTGNVTPTFIILT